MMYSLQLLESMDLDVKTGYRDHLRSFRAQAHFGRSRSSDNCPIHKHRFPGDTSTDGPESISEMLRIHRSLDNLVSCLSRDFACGFIGFSVPANDLVARALDVDEAQISKPRCDDLPEYPPRFGGLPLVGQVAGFIECQHHHAWGDTGKLAGEIRLLCCGPCHDSCNEYSHRRENSGKIGRPP